jgi:hypothetical protein
MCGPISNNQYDINFFQVDTIEFGKENIDISNRQLADLISKLIHSNNLERGLILNLKSATYEEYIGLLDALIRNGIYRMKIENDYVYFFPNKIPRQVEIMRTWFINSDNFITKDLTN